MTDYRHWFQRICLRLELKEGRDYTTLVKKVRRSDGVEMPGRKIDHLLTIAAAKEICLVQSSPIGRMLRRQLVNAEQKIQQAAEVSQQEIRYYRQRLEESNERNLQLTADIAAQNEALAIQAVRIAQQSEIMEKQQVVIQKQSKTVRQMKPKVDYCDRVLNAKDVLTIRAIAKTYNWSGQKLNKFLHEKRIQYKCDGGWVLYARYAGKGYTKYITYVRKCDGIERVRMVMKWTQKGRLFIDRKMREASWMPKEEES
jgi:phage antirepressor YoqD-like protein/phage anti-repressor protein